MRLRQFLNVVPGKVQLWAAVLFGCALLVGLVVGFNAADQGTVLRTMAANAGIAIVVGAVMAIWLLCLGFVFGDARRRSMRPIPWVLVAALFPHLLGFLLYFVLRQPIATPCGHCGKNVPLHQPFCPWCGASLAASSSSGDLQSPLTS